MQWPEQLPQDIQFDNVFDLAQTFESHCAKIYDHATLHPNDVASADYVMRLVSQAYRAVHSLHVQKKALDFWDLNTATAELRKHALKERETCNVETIEHAKVIETPELPVNDQQEEPQHGTLADLINGDFEDDEEEDSDWEESEEETDDEYYEYCEGSDADSELEALGTVAEVEHDEKTITKPQSIQSEEKSDAPEKNEKEETKDASLPPTVPILQDQAMHDRITAALQHMNFSQADPEPKPEPETVVLEPIQTQSDHSTSLSDSSSTRDTQSEATAVQTNSNQDAPHLQPSTIISPEKAAQKPSFDAVRLPRKLAEGSVPTDIPRRLKTVCYKYVRRAMVPIRGKAQ